MRLTCCCCRFKNKGLVAFQNTKPTIEIACMLLMLALNTKLSTSKSCSEFCDQFLKSVCLFKTFERFSLLVETIKTLFVARAVDQLMCQCCRITCPIVEGCWQLYDVKGRRIVGFVATMPNLNTSIGTINLSNTVYCSNGFSLIVFRLLRICGKIFSSLNLFNVKQ